MQCAKWQLSRLGVNVIARHRALALLPAAILIALILYKPVPFIGTGSSDDFKYLSGAHCLTCLPMNHWQIRFLIVWPTGVELLLFGSNIWSMLLFPVACAIAALSLLVALTERQYGRPAALIAGCLLALTPVFDERAMRIGVDVPELALLLGALFVIQRRHPHGWAGLLVALAVLSRPTQLAALPMIAFASWTVDRRQLKWLALGFVAPLALSSLVYWVVAGDPLYAWKLSLHHAQHPSKFLSPSVDWRESELFNPDYIGGWKPNAGVAAHWTVQGIINLLLNREMAFTLWSGIIFAAWSWRKLDRLQSTLIISCGLYFGALTYAFAIDPEPRMFLPVAAAAAALAGSLAPGLWRWPTKMVVVAMIGLATVQTAVSTARRWDPQPSARVADQMLGTTSYELTPGAREALALQRWNPPTGRGHLMHIDDGPCAPSLINRRLIRSVGHVCIYD